jgi:hypothetical protein
MSIFDVCVTITSSIFVIAYPILVEVISRLDEKYSTTVITDLFNDDWRIKLFSFSFYITIALIGIYFFEFRPLPFFPQHSFVLNNSALLIFALWSIFIVWLFVELIKKIFVFYRQIELAKYLIRQHNKLTFIDENSFNNLLFSSISELLLHAIRVGQDKIAKEISNFMYRAFNAIRDRHTNEEVNYPVSYYEMVYAAIEELIPITSSRFVYLQDRTAGSLWLIGEFAETRISEMTYWRMWQNQVLSLKNNRDDFVYMHWQHAHQHYSLQMPQIFPEYNVDFTIKNQPEVNERDRERAEFIYFHTALGALVFYFRKLPTLRKFFQYTQSIPPDYVLLPHTVGEIFDIYFKLSNDFDPFFHQIESKYPFPGFGGLNSGYQIREQIFKYLAILFLRQYGIPVRFVGQEPLRMPAPPTEQSMKSFWIVHLPYFIQKVKEAINDKEALSELGLDFITEEYCVRQHIKPPITLLEDFSTDLKESYHYAEENQEISSEKKQRFLGATLEYMTKTFEIYDGLNNETIPNDGATTNFINGVIQAFDKSAFAEDQGVDHLNFDTILGETLAGKFKLGVAESFYLHRSEWYVVRETDIERSLDRLNIKDKGVALVVFGGIEINYKGVETISYSATSPGTVGQCIFLLKSEDLPRIQYNDTIEQFRTRYDLELLDPAHFLYASVVDLNLRADLREEIGKDGSAGVLKKQVLANIFINVQIKWRPQIKCIALKIASPYREEGIISVVDDIKPF